ncbi:MAG: LCP family protein [bacterium]|nr:LCP family protein [bacterium]
MPKDQSKSSAEKRILWEIRDKYQIPKSPRRGSLTAAARKPTLSGRPQLAHVSPPPAPPRRDSARSNSRLPSRPAKKHWPRRFFILLIIVILFSGGVFGYKILAAGNKISSAERSLIGQIKDLFLVGDKQLKGEADDRINVMLIAIGGAGHSGENLADTVMIASLRPSDNRVSLLSIPRDLYVQVPGQDYYTRINAVHAHGESQKEGQGPEMLRGLVEEVTGLPIHYYGRVDFTAFKQIVDAVGGIDITIPNGFYDYWHKIDFRAGTEKMDGERALAYVRARYIEGPEGGDFKRTTRQQQVLMAIQEKVFSVNTAFDFAGLNKILNSLSDNVRTDMQLWEMKRFYEIARQVKHDNISSTVLTTGPTAPLVGATEILGDTPASVLKTKTGDFSEIQSIAAGLFDNIPKTVTATAPPQASPSTSPTPLTKPTIAIRNGTAITGLAKQTGDDLKDKGYTVTGIGNAASKDTSQTTVYVINDDYEDQAQDIADTLHAQLSHNLPDSEQSTDAQVLIILGTDTGA